MGFWCNEFSAQWVFGPLGSHHRIRHSGYYFPPCSIIILINRGRWQGNVRRDAIGVVAELFVCGLIVNYGSSILDEKRRNYLQGYRGLSGES